MSADYQLLVLEHDVLIGLDVSQVDSIHLFFTLRMKRQAVPTNMSKEESTTEVQRILHSFSEFVVHTMNFDPIINGTLKNKQEERVYARFV